MDFTINFLPEDDIIFVEASGRAEQASFMEVIKASGELFDRHRCRRFFTDYRGLEPDFDHFTVDMLDELAAHYVTLATPRAPFTFAMVCADGTQFALTRVWEVLASRADLAVESRIFLDAAEARRWLDRTRPPRLPAE